jgi:hypothetical protein
MAAFFFELLGVKLRAWSLLGRGSTTWATLPAPFCTGYFQDRVSWIIWLGWLGTSILLISYSRVMRIIEVTHQCLASWTFMGIFSLYNCNTKVFVLNDNFAYFLLKSFDLSAFLQFAKWRFCNIPSTEDFSTHYVILCTWIQQRWLEAFPQFTW